MLKRWVSEYLKTYADLFLRLALVFFVMLTMDKLASVTKDFNVTFINIFILIGALMFAKEAPNLIKQIFNIQGSGSGKFTLNPFKKLAQIPVAGAAAYGALGAAGGAFQGLRKGGIKGALAGGFMGGLAGTKAVPFGGIDATGKGGKGGGGAPGNPFRAGRDSYMQAMTGNPNARAGIFNKMSQAANMAYIQDLMPMLRVLRVHMINNKARLQNTEMNITNINQPIIQHKVLVMLHKLISMQEQ
jgi:hypothetical protein